MKLYDAFGREVDLERLREEQAAPTMSGIRNIYSAMHPSAGLTPERLTVILREAEFGDPFLYLELAEEMEEKDLHYLAVLNTRKEAVCELDDAWVVWLARVNRSAGDVGPAHRRFRSRSPVLASWVPYGPR